MDLMKIVGLALVVVMASLIVKNYKPEFSIPIIVVGGCIFFISIMSGITQMFNGVLELCRRIGLNFEYFEIIFKIIGISYICEFAGSVCRDCGETAVALKVDIAGKLLILTSALPVFSQLIDMVVKVVS